MIFNSTHKDIIEEDVRESRKEMGCLRFDVLNLGGNVFQFYEMYVSKAAIAQHKSTVHFQKWVDFKNRIPGVADSLKITMFEIATSPATYHHSPEPVGAIEHVVVQKLSRPLNPSELEQAHAMKDAVPGMISITCGENYTARGAGYNYGWSTRFVSKEAEADYQQHPAHEKFRKEVIMPLLVRDGGGSGVPAPAIVVDYPLYQQNACGFNASATGQGNNNQGRSDCAGVSTGLQLPDNISMEAAVAASIRIQTLTRKRRAQKVVAHRRKLYGVGFKPSEIEEGVEGVGLSWADEMQPLHWDPRLERRGLGWQIRKLNHIGLVCADIGTSVAFYSDVIGLQQIHRPNFDRYGAWFTMGNVELHLTKGTPPTRSKEDDTDLITHHMAMEIHPTQVEMVKKKLQDMNVPFRQNLSVPRGDVQVKDGPDKSKFDKRSQLVQFIIRDPDGYYIEVLSGGDSLIDLCFPFLSSDGANEVQTIHYHDYDDPHQDERVEIANAAYLKVKQAAWTKRAKKRQIEQTLGLKDGVRVENPAAPPSAYAAQLQEQLSVLAGGADARAGAVVDADKLANLVKRRTVYCDICQSFEPTELEEALRLAHNDVPLAIEVLEEWVRTRKGGKLTYTPPAFLRNGNKFECAPSVPAPQISGQGGGV